MGRIKNIKAFWQSPLRRNQALLGYLFVSPWALGFLIFGLYPIIMSMYYSLCRYDVLRIPQFIGLGNYRELIMEDPYFWKSIWNTVYYTFLRTPLVILGSLLLAVLVNNAVRGIRFFRTIYFIPSIITGVVLSSIWLWMLNPQYGLINTLLAFFGIQGPLWLQSPEWSKPSIIIMSLWSIGGGRMLVFLAALQGIPQQMYEVVDLDGGGWWKKFRYVTIPMVSPVIFLWTVLEIIFSFQVFTEAYVMTKGGPLNSTLFYNLYLYYKAFDDFSMGYASALAWLLLLFILMVTVIQFAVGQKMVYYEGEKS
ncbi:MAG: sugar ABC transporter permease [Candidatus Marinimicrobia bacterium]|nr:sugar ABC transporter permease [Candidatus Neomarinimicrobiota bacterium]